MLGKPRKPSQTRVRSTFETMNMELRESMLRRRRHVASKTSFNFFIAIAILLNAVIVGIEVDYGWGDRLEDRFLFFVFDLIFCFVFFVEMLLRISQMGWDYFVDYWNLFDYTLVILGCLALVQEIRDNGARGAMIVGAVRIMRYTRVVDHLGGLRAFRELFLIIKGLILGIRTLFWVAMLLAIMVYVVAIFLATFVGQSQYCKEHWRYTEQYVGSVLRAMWTMIQVITFDNWATDVARPMGEVAPGIDIAILCGILVCSLGILNVAVAVMVQQVLTLARETNAEAESVLERADKMILKSMATGFLESDADGSAELDIDEFKQLVASPEISMKLRLLGVRSDEADNLFELLDADGSGTLSPEEFIAGLQKYKGQARGQDLVQLICFTQKQGVRARKFTERAKKMNKKADKIQERLNRMGRTMGFELSDREEAEGRAADIWSKAADFQRAIRMVHRERDFAFPDLEGDTPGPSTSPSRSSQSPSRGQSRAVSHAASHAASRESPRGIPRGSNSPPRPALRGARPT